MKNMDQACLWQVLHKAEYSSRVEYNYMGSSRVRTSEGRQQRPQLPKNDH